MSALGVHLHLTFTAQCRSWPNIKGLSILLQEQTNITTFITDLTLSMLLYTSYVASSPSAPPIYFHIFFRKLFSRPDSFLEWTVEDIKYINKLMYPGSRYDILNLPLFSRSLTSQPPFPPLGGCFSPVATKSSSRPRPKPHQYSPPPASWYHPAASSVWTKVVAISRAFCSLDVCLSLLRRNINKAWI